jgi:predicted O-linked N-acetylglucosamine transferase (SPINDLY family)
VFFVLALVFQRAERPQEAVRWYEKILEHKQDALVLNELAVIYQTVGRYSQAVECRRRAMYLEPDSAWICTQYAVDLMGIGRIHEGIDLLRRITGRYPANPLPHSKLLWWMHCLPESDRQALFDEHRRWGEIHAPMSLAKTSHDNVPDPNRRLRVGYISADFRMHSVAYNFEAFLNGRHRESVEVYGYANVSKPDKVTEHFKGQFDHYRSVCGLSDEELVRLIEQDRIDILVPIGGHVSGSRLPALARKPAPVQVDYGGIDTTGMDQIDYILSDILLDPPGSQRFYVEELVPLAGGVHCYVPPDSTPPVATLAAEKNGFTTYGSFNGSPKVNPYIVSLWARVLEADTDSRFLMKFPGGDDPALRDRYWGMFEQLGISRERVEICGWRSSVEHLKLYDRVDIALDTYPYNGCLTTLEALWMGVPVVTLVGKHRVSRVGLSLLSRIGLEFFAVSTPDEYLRKATALSQSRESLAKIRASLRQRMESSVLCDANRFAREVEAAYRKMWHRWCRSRGVDVPGREPEVEASVDFATEKGCGVQT